jgi:signal transduction histidine kinase
MGFKSLSSSQLQYNARRSDAPVGGDAFNSGMDERLAERVHIAQDLHDTLLQGFFAVSMQLHTAVDNLPADFAATPRFSGILDRMDRVLEEGRRAVQGLRSDQEHGPSLGHALASVPRDLGAASSPVDFKVVVVGKPRELKLAVSDELYCIGREAIVNAYRHSRAGRIETEIEYRATELRIAVRDDGCGIDPHQLQWGRPGHWGLQGMRERAERIGAQLRLLSKVAAGTEVELCVPSRIAFMRREAWAAF